MTLHDPSKYNKTNAVSFKFTAIQKQCEELEQLFASISAGTMFYRFEAGLPHVEFPLPKP